MSSHLMLSLPESTRKPIQPTNVMFHQQAWRNQTSDITQSDATGDVPGCTLLTSIHGDSWDRPGLPGTHTWRVQIQVEFDMSPYSYNML